MRKFREVQKKLGKRGKSLPNKGVDVNKLMRGDEVFFWQSTDACNCVDTENCQNTCCGSIAKGIVMINDPPMNSCRVSIVSEDSGESVICVPYTNLRAAEDATKDRNHSRGDDSEIAESDVEEPVEELVTPAKKRKCRNVPYVPMDSLIDEMEIDSELTYVPCSNGALKVGIQASYGNEIYAVDRIYFDCQKRKPFVIMTHVDDPDIRLQIPPTYVRCANFTEIRHETFDLLAMEDPVDKAFAVFSGIKRLIIMCKKKPHMTSTLALSSALTRKICGFQTSNPKEMAKFYTHIENGKKGCNESWDNVLGPKWDVVQRDSPQEKDTLIRSLTFTEYRDFGMHTIRCHIHTCEEYCSSEKYREVYRDNHRECPKEGTVENIDN